MKTWCDRNNVSEQSYYYWLRKIRTKAIHAVASSNSSFTPIPIQEVMKVTNSMMITITKGDIHIEVPDTIERSILESIMSSLLC